MTEEVVKKRKRKRKKKKLTKKQIWIRVAIGAVVAILLAVLCFVGYVGYSFYQMNQEIYEPIPETEMREEPVDTNTLEPVSVLLMGIDSREGVDEGRSDTMIVVTIDPENNTTTLLSIPRDAYVYIEGYGYDKINHAYAFGGPQLAVETVENFLDIPIDYYVAMDFQGFVDLVDLLGGVTVYNEFAFSSGGYDYPEGEIHLDGEEALAYCRMRYDDPEGDAGRQQRQQQVIMSLVEEATQISSVSQITEIFEVLGNHMITNLSPTVIWDMMLDYMPALDNIVNVQLPFSGFTGEDGIYYAAIDDEVRVQVSNQLRTSLGLEVRDRQYYIDQGYDIALEDPNAPAPEETIEAPAEEPTQ